MGFLNNTTNNIILDAVLTDTGRALLAKNNRSFNVRQFALFDDEVDYSIIKKYGSTVGDEKIIKNTLVTEAVTNPSLSAKYKLVTTRARNVTYLPELITELTTITLSLNAANINSSSSSLVVVGQRMPTNSTVTTIDNSLINNEFEVVVNDNFLQITDANSPSYVDSFGMATYNILVNPAQTAPASNGTIQQSSNNMRFTIQARRLTTAQFTLYGSNSQISTNIRVTGMQSGAVLDIPVTISLT